MRLIKTILKLFGGIVFLSAYRATKARVFFLIIHNQRSGAKSEIRSLSGKQTQITMSVFLVGFPKEKPTILFARRLPVEFGSSIVFRFMTSGVQKYPYLKFIYLYVCMYVCMYVCLYVCTYFCI